VVKRYSYFKKVVKSNYRILLIIGFIFGCILNEELEISNIIEVLSVLSILGFILVPKLGLIIIFILLGVLRMMFENHLGIDHIAHHINKEAEVISTVISYPQIKNHEQILILKPSSINVEKEQIQIKRGYMQLKLSKYTKIEKGDLLKFVAYIEEPENFDGFDYVGHLKSQKIYALVKNPTIMDIKKSDSYIEAAILKVRNRVVNDINKSFPDPHAKLLAGMLIGTREQFSPQFANNLSITSTSHVVAVSGYNISLVSSSILGMSGYIHRRVLIFFSFLGLIFFLLLVGLDNLPAFRAGLMGFVMLLAMLIGRRGAGVFTLFLIAGLMHLQNPYIYNSLSFQLSFSATLGLMLLSSKLKIQLERILKTKHSVEELSTTLSALIVTFPITFSSFGKITIYGLLANVLIAPMITNITFLGIVFVIVNIVSGQLAFVIKALLWGLLETMVRIVDVIARFPLADLSFDNNLLPISLMVILVTMLAIFELNFREFSGRND
jgi:competence protein ComEC